MNIKVVEFQNILSGTFHPLDAEVEAPKITKQNLVVCLEGNSPGVQGLPDNLMVEDFELVHDALRFDSLIGEGLSALDDNIESVMDTGEALVFNFMGGGSLTLNGISGYNDFTSLSMDYNIEILS